jgi:hypothetical protein
MRPTDMATGEANSLGAEHGQPHGATPPHSTLMLAALMIGHHEKGMALSQGAS